MCMERETEGVDAVRLAVRVYSLVWGEEGSMQDGGCCPDRGMGTVGSLPEGDDEGAAQCRLYRARHLLKHMTVNEGTNSKQ